MTSYHLSRLAQQLSASWHSFLLGIMEAISVETLPQPGFALDEKDGIQQLREKTACDDEPFVAEDSERIYNTCTSSP